MKCCGHLIFKVLDRDPTPASCFLNWLVQGLERKSNFFWPGEGVRTYSIWEPGEQRHWPQKALPETSLFIQGHTL